LIFFVARIPKNKLPTKIKSIKPFFSSGNECNVVLVTLLKSGKINRFGKIDKLQINKTQKYDNISTRM